VKYRNEIDGLRAVAVLAVIFFHAGFPFFSGGFVGVDVFFVISGYLITTIIHDEITSHSFSIVRFYERRMRRILPALFLVLLMCVLPAWIFLIPDQFKDFSKSLVAVNLFASNALFWQESNYFAPAAELKPLLHTWSLAVEEQFYVIFPLILLLCRNFRDVFLLILIGSLSLVSLIVSDYGAAHFPTANFYLPFGRAWELGAGAMLVLALPRTARFSPCVSQALSVIGFVMILYAVIFFDRGATVPGFGALVPVVGTVLIIAFSTQNTWVGQLLGWRPLVSIGLISYSAYLWHHPIFAFYKINALGQTDYGTYLLLIAATLVCAYFSWKYVETPFRRRQSYSRQQIFALAACCSVIFIGFGTLGYIQKGMPSRYSDRQNALLKFQSYDIDKAYRRGSCFLWEGDVYKAIGEQCFSGKGSAHHILLWGDSHAAALSFGLREISNASQLTAATCFPSINVQAGYSHCQAFNRFSLQKIADLKPEWVVLFDNWRPHKLALGDTAFVSSLKATIKQILDASPASHIAVVGGVPQWYPSLPEVMVRRGVELQNEAFVASSRYSSVRETDQLLRQLSSQSGVKFISLLDKFCQQGQCLSSVQDSGNTEPLVWDYGHLTKNGSRAAARYVVETLGMQHGNE